MSEYRQAVGDSWQERMQAEKEDQFTFDAATAAAQGKDWNEFLSGSWEYRNCFADDQHRKQYNDILSRTKFNKVTGHGTNDPQAEVAAVRAARAARYEQENTERRYQEIRDEFLERAFRCEPWEQVEREVKNLEPNDRILYQRARKEAGTHNKPDALDPWDLALEQGFFS
jgi:hypothetical protein